MLFIRFICDIGSAKNLFTPVAVAKRHSIAALPDADKSRLRKNQSWSRIKASPRGMLEPKSYEKVYTLKKVGRCDGGKVAVVKMNAVPSVKPAEICRKMIRAWAFSQKCLTAAISTRASYC